MKTRQELRELVNKAETDKANAVAAARNAAKAKFLAEWTKPETEAYFDSILAATASKGEKVVTFTATELPYDLRKAAGVSDMASSGVMPAMQDFVEDVIRGLTEMYPTLKVLKDKNGFIQINWFSEGEEYY